jgi:iron complex outermembrane receptor protein
MNSAKCNNVDAAQYPVPMTRIKPRQTILAQAVSAVILGTAVAGPAYSQGALEEIIVTATKRAESLDEVPLSITALSGDFTRAVNLDDVKDLITFTPGVTGNSKDSYIDAVSVRGIRTQDFGVGGDPSAAFFKNNLYEGRNGAVVTSLYDMDRSEILRGPQGFLYGRNAIGGAFSVHTKKPNLDGEQEAYVDLDVGERGHFVTEGAVTVGVTENFAMRFAGFHSTEDGYVDNAFTPGKNELIGHDKSALRVSGLYEADALAVNFFAEYEQREQSGSVYRISELSPRTEVFEDIFGPVNNPADPRDTNSDLSLGSTDDADILTLGIEFEYDFDGLTLTSTTGFKDHDYFYTEDYDGTRFNLNDFRQDQEGSYFQTELRLTSDSDGPLSWYAGASYYKEDLDVIFTNSGAEEAFCAYYGAYYYQYTCTDYFAYWQAYYPGYGIPDFTPSSDGRMNELNYVKGAFSGWAAYVDLNYKFNDLWDVSFGLRYTVDEKSFSVNVPPPESLLQSYFFPGYMTAEPIGDKKDWSDLTPRVILRYFPNDDTTLFASVTTGYKSGGFGTFSLNPAVFQWFGDGPDEPLTKADGYTPDTFKPETVISYEIGYKGTLMDGRGRLDLSAFMYDYEDLQVNYFDVGSSVGNAEHADGLGLEASFTASLTDNFDVFINAAWLDTEATGVQFLCDFTDDCEGNGFYWAPEFSGAAVLNVHFPMGSGELFGSAEVSWESERGRGWENLIDSQIDAYQEWTVRFGYRAAENWHITMYIENVTDELTWDGAANNGGIVPAFYFGPSRPRTLGMSFGWEFD